jgi:hypothetical protein
VAAFVAVGAVAALGPPGGSLGGGGRLSFAAEFSAAVSFSDPSRIRIMEHG